MNCGELVLHAEMGGGRTVFERFDLERALERKGQRAGPTAKSPPVQRSAHLFRIDFPDPPAVRFEPLKVVQVGEPDHAHDGLVVDGAERDVDPFPVSEGVPDQRVGLDFRVREREEARDGPRRGPVRRGEQPGEDRFGCMRVTESGDSACAHELAEFQPERAKGEERSLTLGVNRVGWDPFQPRRDPSSELLLGLLDRHGRRARPAGHSLARSQILLAERKRHKSKFGVDAPQLPGIRSRRLSAPRPV